MISGNADGPLGVRIVVAPIELEFFLISSLIDGWWNADAEGAGGLAACIHDTGAMMREQIGSIRTSLQGPCGGAVAATRERPAGGGGSGDWGE
jgi:hypothetical protein